MIEKAYFEIIFRFARTLIESQKFVLYVETFICALEFDFALSGLVWNSLMQKTQGFTLCC